MSDQHVPGGGRSINLGVHITHCCPGHCKYGDDGVCPVATGAEPPAYECENCYCEVFHPEVKYDRWWSNLSPAQRRAIYEDHQR